MKNIFLGTLLAVCIGACSSPKKESKEEIIQPEAPAAAEAIKPRVFFITPADGATVSSSILIEMGVEGMQVEPAGPVKVGFGHHHILINQASWPTGTAIPVSDSTLHFGKGQTSTTLELKPGEYTLSLQFADGIHTSYGPDMAASIRVTVQ